MMATKKIERSPAESRYMRTVRLAERQAHEDNLKKLQRQEIDAPPQDAGTGQTILKMKYIPKPLESLVVGKKIGAVEVQAADQILLAALSLQYGGYGSSWVLERVDRSSTTGLDWPAHVAKAVRNFQEWQNHWSAKWKKTGNPMSGVIWDAVVNDMPIYAIAANRQFGWQKIERAIVCGLRHYAAWTGLVAGGQATVWFEAADDVFDRR